MLDNVDHPADLRPGGDGARPRPSRLAPDVDDIGSFGQELVDARARGPRLEIPPSITERVWRHVADAHQRRPASASCAVEHFLKRLKSPNHLLARYS